MRYCPKCRSEYQDWVQSCIDCGTALVDYLPEEPQPPAGKYSTEQIVTIATFNHPEEAYIQQGRLESEGIPSLVADDNIVTANRFYSAATGGVRLQVRESDASEALRILNLSPESSDFMEDAGESCPHCNSTDIQYETFSLRWVFLSIIFLGFPLLFYRRKWKCHTCGYEWKQRQ